MLPKEHRLRANPDFRRVYARGRSHVHELAVLHVLRRKPEDADSALCRVGFVVSKKQGDAVVRNRIKRRLREAMRLRWPEVRSAPVDLVFVGRSRLKTAEWPAVVQALETLLRRANMLNSARDSV